MGKLSIGESSKLKHNIKKTQIWVVVAALATGMFLVTQPVLAVDYDSEIKKLQNENATRENSRKNLQSAALSMEAQIANLRATIGAIDSLIVVNETQRNNLTGNIATLETQIAEERVILKESIRDLYIENDMTMLEKMASSRNLSDYVEKEQFTVSAQTEVQNGIEKINKMQNEQKKQRKQVEQLIQDNKMMQAKLGTDKQELDRLLAANQSEQSAVSATIASANSQITDLQRRQAEENARWLREQAAQAAAVQRVSTQPSAPPVVSQPAPANVMAVNGNGYPWANAPWPNDIPDPWGMYQRQCVSYTAWKVSASGRHMPNWGGFGNAKQWDDNARAAGIPVDNNPRVGDVAIRNAGTYGHSMYVEAVNSDGSINISQYNANWDGRYSEARIFPGDLVFIHF